MPATTATDLIDVFEPTRTCNFPEHSGERTLPFTRQNFYVRPNGTADYWCRACVRINARNRRGNRRRERTMGVNTTRQFGVEIEFVGDRFSLANEMTARGLTVSYEGYTHRVRRGAWKIVTDASLSSGYELVSPPLRGAAGLADLRKASEALVASGARINRQCGLHVHHDVTDLDLPSFQRLFRGWSNAQGATDQLVAASRRGSMWAQPLRENEVQRIESLRNVERSTVQAMYIDRYRALNVTAFPRYGTVEARQHQGTINAGKIVAWIKFGQAMIERAKSDADQPATRSAHTLLDQLADHGLDADTVAYLKARAEAFGFAAPVAAREMAVA